NERASRLRVRFPDAGRAIRGLSSWLVSIALSAVHVGPALPFETYMLLAKGFPKHDVGAMCHVSTPPPRTAWVHPAPPVSKFSLKTTWLPPHASAVQELASSQVGGGPLTQTPA